MHMLTMARRRTKQLAAVAILATAATYAPQALTASPAVASSQAGGIFRLAVTSLSGAVPARTATLTCTPDGGTHGDAVSACDQLRAADGRIDAIPEQPGYCTMESAPVRVSARGFWNGDHRRYARTFENRCLAIRATGGSVLNF
ncbi:SSI family serine proteinase inhibitor [Nonomuraea typhae]|uniref:SSI family serine proteinase inhibitor n=1 Tax=Nonomuraea typhae TaxID=2603600 RepID=A0ABW7Z1A0_9ACTN